MIICAHRINTIEGLKKIPHQYGVEVDIRCMGEKLILNHEPHQGGDDFHEYMKHYKHRFIILNIKEAGIEDEVVKIVESHGVHDYFLLDVEYPYIYRATRKQGQKKIAVRYSEAEPIEFALAHHGLVDWVWVDTNTKLPLDEHVAKQLRGFKLALVSPDRWGRPADLALYRDFLKKHHITIDLVMVDHTLIHEWEV